jgi:hypothetical protein
MGIESEQEQMKLAELRGWVDAGSMTKVVMGDRLRRLIRPQLDQGVVELGQVRRSTA